MKCFIICGFSNALSVACIRTLTIKRVNLHLLFCHPRIEVTSCFVYKVMGLTFNDRINTQLIYRIVVAQVVTRRITKPQRTFFRFESHWLLFLFISFYFFIFFFFFFFFFFFWGGGRGEGGGGGGLILLFSSCLIFLFIFYDYFLFFIPFTCIRYIYKNFWNNTSYCKFGNTREYER